MRGHWMGALAIYAICGCSVDRGVFGNNDDDDGVAAGTGGNLSGPGAGSGVSVGGGSTCTGTSSAGGSSAGGSSAGGSSGHSSGSSSSSGSGGAGGDCAADVCAVGPPIPDDCNACTQIVCGSYPNCCTTGWTADCVILATFLCGPCAS